VAHRGQVGLPKQSRRKTSEAAKHGDVLLSIHGVRDGAVLNRAIERCLPEDFSGIASKAMKCLSRSPQKTKPPEVVSVAPLLGAWSQGSTVNVNVLLWPLPVINIVRYRETCRAGGMAENCSRMTFLAGTPSGIVTPQSQTKVAPLNYLP
jgi:hypothetical protein